MNIDGSGGGERWGWHPEKTALEYLWRSGERSTSHRVNFQKVYDLTERVFPAHVVDGEVPAREEFVDWACGEAVARLGFATAREIADFLGFLNAKDVRPRCQDMVKSGELVRVVVALERRGKNGRIDRSCMRRV